jgi:hypothetical protein
LECDFAVDNLRKSAWPQFDIGVHFMFFSSMRNEEKKNYVGNANVQVLCQMTTSITCCGSSLPLSPAGHPTPLSLPASSRSIDNPKFA